MSADPPWAVPCTAAGCGRTATYRVTWDERLPSGRPVRTTQTMCDTHAYDRQRDDAATIWALNE